MRIIYIIILFIFIIPDKEASGAGPPSAQNYITFKSGLEKLLTALKSSPSIKSFDAKKQAAIARSAMLKSIDPPQIGLELYQAPVSSFPNPFRDQMEYDYSIQQMIPFPGKPRAMSAAELKRAEMLGADQKTLEQDITRKVKSLYYEIYLKDRQAELNSETQKLVRRIIDISQRQFEVGLGKQSEILRAQTELSAARVDSIVIFQERMSMQGMLNSLCSRQIDAAIEFIPEITPELCSYNRDTLIALAEKNRSELTSMETEIGMYRSERIAARKERLPDFMVKGTYKQMMEGEDYWSLMIGATIPVAPWSLRKIRAGTALSDANILDAQSKLADMRNMISSEVNDAVQKIDNSIARIKLARETSIPQAEKTLESALAAYKTGNEEFLMLIDIQKMVVMAELDYHMAAMTLLDSQSQLERAVGLGMDAICKFSIKGGN